MKRRIFSTVTMAVATSFALAACSSPDEDATGAQETTATSEAHDHDNEGHDHDGPDADDADLTEVSSLPQRVVLSHDKGLTTIDPSTGEIVAEEEISGFHRLNPAGNTTCMFPEKTVSPSSTPVQ